VKKVSFQDRAKEWKRERVTDDECDDIEDKLRWVEWGEWGEDWVERGLRKDLVRA